MLWLTSAGNLVHRLAKLERRGFRLLPRLIRGPSGTFGNVAATLPNQPLPLAADMQNGEIAGAERADRGCRLVAVRERRKDGCR